MVSHTVFSSSKREIMRIGKKERRKEGKKESSHRIPREWAAQHPGPAKERVLGLSDKSMK